MIVVAVGLARRAMQLWVVEVAAVSEGAAGLPPRPGPRSRRRWARAAPNSRAYFILGAPFGSVERQRRSVSMGVHPPGSSPQHGNRSARISLSICSGLAWPSRATLPVRACPGRGGGIRRAHRARCRSRREEEQLDSRPCRKTGHRCNSPCRLRSRAPSRVRQGLDRAEVSTPSVRTSTSVRSWRPSSISTSPADSAPTPASSTWGSPGGAARRAVAVAGARSRSIRLGSYRYDTRVVRIHRALDHPEVPRFVVESVVHHELVHAALPEPAVGWDGRRRIHTPEFRHLEREFVHHRQAQEWIAQNFRRLLELR